VDEAGRGRLHEADYASAIIIDATHPITGIGPSKKITESGRDELDIEIKLHALAWAIATSSVEEIDEINILQASLLAMKRAVEAMQTAFAEVLNGQVIHVQVDGNKRPKISLSCEAIVKGDSKVQAISAASILAKTARDANLYELDRQYPMYGFAQHKGYPTKGHMALLQEHGVLPVHRRSYAPVKKLLG